MANDLPDYTAQVAVNLVGGSSAANLGDVGAPVAAPDSATEQLSGGGGALQAVAALASFKPSGVIARVGALGAFLAGSPTQVSPLFGQATSAGDLLVAWVTSFNGQPTTAAAGWVRAASAAAGSVFAEVWVRPNCGAAEAAPVFTSAGSQSPMAAQLAEFSGAVTVGPIENTAQGFAGSGINSVTATAAAADAAFGDLVVMAVRWLTNNTTSPGLSDAYDNRAAAVQAGSAYQLAAGFPHLSSFSYGIIPAASSSLPLGERTWDYDARGSSLVASGSQSKVVLAATPGKTYRCHLARAAVTAQTATASGLSFQVLDGASAIYQEMLGTTAAIGSNSRAGGEGWALRGTAGNSMTAQISAAAAGIQGSVNIGAYLQ